MIYKEFGEHNPDTMIFLHGGGLSWWNYKDEIELLKKDFHLIIPVLDGHADSDRDFCSIENNASEIVQFIDEHCNGNVKLIAGLSLGGQILLDILAQRKDICEYAVVESALVLPMKTTYKLIEPTFHLSYGLIRKKWFSKLQFDSLKIKKELFELYFEDTCKITKNNLIAFMKANSDYKMKETLSQTDAKVLILVGSKERPIMKKSARKISAVLHGGVVKELKDLYHGDISINHADEYVKLLRAWME